MNKSIFIVVLAVVVSILIAVPIGIFVGMKLLGQPKDAEFNTLETKMQTMVTAAVTESETTVPPETTEPEKVFSWLDMSGTYIESENGFGVTLYVSRDLTTGEYYAVYDGALLEQVTVDDNVLFGRFNNADYTFTYDPDTETVGYRYYYYGSGYGMSSTLVLQSPVTRDYADAEISMYYEETAKPAAPVYDMTKASGILAEAGVTEAQFRSMCTPLLGDVFYNWRYNNSSSETFNNPEPYILSRGKAYYEAAYGDLTVQNAIAKWDEICKDYQNGGGKYHRHGYKDSYSTYDYHVYEKYLTLDAYLNDTVYMPKGIEIMDQEAEQLFASIKEYPDHYRGKPYMLMGAYIDPNNSYVYFAEYFVETDIIINDRRDNVHAPNIISGNEYYLYVVFDGTFVASDGDIGLEFSMLCLDKVG